MSSSNKARKRLPVKPSQENLKKQAKRLAKLESIQLADAQHRLAVDYGSKNWAGLMQLVEAMNRSADVPLMSSAGTPNKPLQAAARGKDIDAVRRLLEAGQYTQEELDAGLAGALWYGEGPTQWPMMKAIADLLLDYGADVDGQFGTYGPIVFGTGECLVPDSLQYLIDSGADVTFGFVDTKYGKQCPLSYWLGTYARGHNDRKHRGVEILLRHSAFIPPEVSPPILAIHRGDAKTLADLLDRDRSLVNRRFADLPYGNIHLVGATLLHCAAEFDEIECCNVLLDRYADINAKADVIDGVGGQTPIFHVLNTNSDSHLETLKYLVNRGGARIDLSVRATWRTFDGPRTSAVTPLEYAEEPGNEKWRKNKEAEIAILRSLAAGIGEANRTAGATRSILSLLEDRDEDAAVKMLQADPSLRDAVGTNGLTPLQAAAQVGAAQVVRILLDLVAPVDGVGNSPLWLACQSDRDPTNRIEVAELLLKAGANPRRESDGRSTPLHQAAWRGPMAMVELLLRHNAKEWQGDKDGKLPIDYAREKGVSADREQIIELLDRPVIRDPNFRAAVKAIQTGDLASLKQLLADHPNLVHDRAMEPACYPQSYFSNPRLLWFVADNPNLIETMPRNSVEVAAAIIDAGAEQADLQYTLGLVTTSRPVREQHLQRPLIKLLLDRGATVDPNDLAGTLGHGERDAVAALLEAGMPMNATVAAGMGDVAALAKHLPEATPEQKHAAFSMAVINKELEAARLCLAAGADPNRFMAMHQHSTAVHQAAIHDNVPMLQLLVEHGAKINVHDTLWSATPLGWAMHEKKTAAEAYLKSLGATI